MKWIDIKNGLPEDSTSCIIVYLIDDRYVNYHLASYSKEMNVFLTSDAYTYKPEEILAYCIFPKYNSDKKEIKEEYICYDSGEHDIDYYGTEKEAVEHLQYIIDNTYDVDDYDETLQCFVAKVTHKVKEIKTKNIDDDDAEFLHELIIEKIGE